MAKLRVPAVLIFFALFGVGLVEPLMHDSISKFLGSFTPAKQVRIPELLNQLCNQSQGSNAILQDACYGCFFRATNQPLGYSLLVAMSNCANIYLNDTDYRHCQQYLRNATTSIDPRINPTTVYCTFLECIRQVNKDNLDARVIPRRVARKSSFFYLKLYKRVVRGICIIREQNSELNTIRPGAEPIDPRRQSIQPKTVP
ncbi:uncharacterized protein LOC128892636 isoform X3 [Hylaeus anthracinus]|uniref:uncharacterized protein LOC128892635 isoform X3 n=1 Tax=Hylaeus anthracinus TaxID=313031 RepID=UPI0023B91F1B|nr:uncharacterized protein LOC128892635 isoform X3 [Hylaeus anthracinus]XP_054009147.1 uncharacterized protein LOC128892636 isoform X3 [Hylaeus anthracinus]